VKRGHVPRRAAQVANFGLFLLIIGVCGFLAWRASEFEAFVVPEDYISGYVEKGGFLWRVDRARVFSAGAHRVSQNEDAASSPAFRLGRQSFAFDSAAQVDVALWKNVRNLLTRGQPPIIRVRGVIEATVTKQTIEALLLSGDSIDHALKDGVARVLPKAAKESASSREEVERALLDGLVEALGGRIHLTFHRVQIDDVSEVDSISPTTIHLPSDFVVQKEIINRTPPEAYAAAALAVLFGSFFFLVIRLLFADLIALVILTPFQWVGILEDIHWRVPEDEERAKDGGSVDLGVMNGPFPSVPACEGAPPASEPGPVAGSTIDAGSAPELLEVPADGLDLAAEIPGEFASGAAEVAAETVTLATEAVGGALGELAGGLAEGVGGCGEGCLGGIFG